MVACAWTQSHFWHRAVDNLFALPLVRHRLIVFPVLLQVFDVLLCYCRCDVGKQLHREKGLWDANLFDYAGVYDAEFSLDKAGRLDYHQTQMTHAMLFTGVDIADGRARRWRVENSYGGKIADKGFFQMNDSWFDEYMFEIAVPKTLLSSELQEALEIEPIILPPWDPMGALAR